jgi:ZIP family zinc transporter
VIYFGVSVDLFSDGIMVGTGSTVAVGLGLLLALGQVPSDVPEGFATIANFRRQGVSRWMRLLLAAAFAVPIFLGATIGYWLMRDAPELNKLLLLTFTAGVLSTLVVEELVPEAVEEVPEHPLSALSFIGGFALFALLSAYLELE